MRVGDFLAYIAQLKGVPEHEALPRASALLEQTGLVNVEKKRCEELSKGMLHRVEFVAAIINRPELIILDEPFSGLDPVSVKRLKELVATEQRRGATILFSTHIMAHAEELCQHVVMIHRGRKVLDEPMAGLRRQYDPRTIQVEPLDEGAPLQVLRQIPGVADVQLTADGCDVHLQPGADPTAAMQQMPRTSVWPGSPWRACGSRTCSCVWLRQTRGIPRPSVLSGTTSGSCRRRSSDVNRILLIARREFMATVSNKGFLIGLFVFPALIALFLLVGPRLLSVASQPRVVGRVAVIDPTGRVAPLLRSTLDSSAIKHAVGRTPCGRCAGFPAVSAIRLFSERSAGFRT